MERRRRPIPRFVRWLAAAVLLVAIGIGVTFLLTREHSDPVRPSRVVARFRAEQRREGARAARPSVPPSGVYRYATTGFEQAQALGKRRHSYPRVTTVSVVSTACGWRERWDALTTRFEVRAYCRATDGLHISTFTDEHEFAGHNDRRTYRCDSGSLAAPPPGDSGATWTSRCSIPGTRIDERGRAVGSEVLTVGGTRVPTLHVRSRITNSGDSDGRGVTDRWLARRTGVLVQERVTNANTTHTFAGDVPYGESYELRLISLEPLR